MHVTIYADVLFLTNFLSDFLLLLLTKKITASRINICRLLLGATIGSIYALVLFFVSLPTITGIFLQMIVALTMLCTTFRFRSLKQLLQYSLVFYILSLLSGGCAYALFFTTALGSKTGAMFKNGIFYWDVPIYIVPLAFSLAYVLCTFLEKLIVFYKLRKQNIYTLQIHYGSKQISLCALEDTGNALYDPFSMLPVIIAEKNIVQTLLNQNTDMELLHQVPYRTISGEKNFLPAIRPDKITINGRVAGDCMLAIADTQLSFDGRYNALLHSAVFQGGYYEHHTKLTANH